jgi:uracil phosphoribosyltransferase
MTETACSSNGSEHKEAADFGPSVHISQHPVIAHKITILRSSTTPSGTFRAVLRELTYHLGYEATSTLTTVPVPISVPVHSIKDGDQHMDWRGDKLKERVALIPILRSGQGMIEAMMELLPKAAVHHIGMYKVLGSTPVQYYNRLPRECKADVAYVLDPVMATSSTIMSVIGILKKVGYGLDFSSWSTSIVYVLVESHVSVLFSSLVGSSKDTCYMRHWIACGPEKNDPGPSRCFLLGRNCR